MSDLAIRMVHVDDQEMVRLAIERLLAADERVVLVGAADSIESARELLDDLRPDVAMVEPLVDHGRGLALIRWIRNHHPSTTVVVFSAVTHPAFVREVASTGASGFIGKGHTTSDISDIVISIHELGAFDWDELTRIDRVIPPDDADRLRLLTPRERQVLRAIGEGATNRAIARRYGLTEKTVKNYVSHLLAKLDMRTRAEAAALAGRLDFAEHPELPTSEWHEVLPLGPHLAAAGRGGRRS